MRIEFVNRYDVAVLGQVRHLRLEPHRLGSKAQRIILQQRNPLILQDQARIRLALSPGPGKRLSCN